MPKEQQPPRQSVNRRHAKRSGAIKSTDPPQHTKLGTAVEASYQHRATTPSIGHQLARLAIDLHTLARHPWVFAVVVLTYFILSTFLLIQKMSLFNASFILISSLVLIYAFAHNLLELIDCLGTIFRQLGGALSVIGRKLRRIARRMKQAFGQTQRV